jgi:DNA-binding NtrC family response regulator
MLIALVIDDDTDVRELLVELLSERVQIVVSAASAEEGLKLLKDNHIDFVISDLNLPSMSGLELSKEIKKQSPGLPIVMVTGDHLDERRRGQFEGRISDFISKPFDTNEFFKVVDRLIDEKSAA